MSSLFKFTTEDGQVWHIVAKDMVKALKRLNGHHGHFARKVEEVWPFDIDEPTEFDNPCGECGEQAGPYHCSNCGAT